MLASKRIINKLRGLYWELSSYKIINVKHLYKCWEANHLKKLLSQYDVDCVFDVGANFGQYAQMLRNKAHYKGLIISFEPIPEAAKALTEKALNDPNWIIIEQALSDHDGTQEFNIMRDSQFSSLSNPRHDEVNRFQHKNKVENSLTIKTETLTTAYQRLQKAHNFTRPFLKMDTQGYDAEIVKHSKAIMTEFIGLQSELAIKKMYEKSMGYQDALAIYEECGFSLSAFVPNNEGHFPQLIETDCIMIRSDLIQTSPHNNSETNLQNQSIKYN